MKKLMHLLLAVLMTVTYLTLSPSAASAERTEDSDTAVNIYGELNACGTVNRTASVDPVGRKDGFSAVLYNNTNGLPTSEANAIAETDDGFLWIGSFAGLIRYDGNSFERVGATSGISSVKCLYVDSQDRLWIGTNDNGVALMEKGAIRLWGKVDGMKSAHVRGIAEGLDGTIYIATTSGIGMMDQNFKISWMEDKEIAEANMRDIRRGRDGVLYGTTDLGDLMFIKDRKLLRYISLADNPLGGAGAVLSDPDNPGMYYMEGVDLHLYHMRVELADDNALTIVKDIEIAPLMYVKSLESIDGRIWVCTGSGIGVLKDGELTVLDNLPMNNNVGHVMTDYLGNLWFTSTRQGVMKVVPNQFSSLFDRFGLAPRVVNSTCMSDGKLFVGTDKGLMVLDDSGPLESFPLTSVRTASGQTMEETDLLVMLAESRIRSIIADRRGRLWISTWRTNDLLRLDHGELTVFREKDGLLSNSLRAVCEREDGSILVAVTGGVNIIEGDAVTGSYGSADGIENTESLTVSEGLNGEILLGSNGGGIYVIDQKGVRNIDVEEGLPSDIVMRLKRDAKRNVVWIVASSALAYMTPDYQIHTIQKFPYTNNFDLYESASGDIWVLSSNGIYVTPARELIDNEDLHPVFFGIDSGLSCIATANSYSSLTEDGDLYIAGSTGICEVNINEPFEDVKELKAGVPYVDVDGQRLYPNKDGSFTIQAEAQKLTVPSFVFNFSLSNPLVSRYLDGFEQQGAAISRSEMVPVDYTNLSGRDYEYVMELHDALGRGKKEIRIKIVKEKKLHEQLWFILLMVGLGLGAAALMVRWYVRSRMQKLEKQNRDTMELIGEITEAFAKIIDMKDAYTNGHSMRVAKYTAMLTRELGYDEATVEKYYRIALLHDIGKIGVPPEVLNKAGKLTDEEYEIIKSHASKGYEALKDISIMPELAVGAQAHHERPDGRGYPNHLKGDEIPRVAQIIAVADCFDAMYSNRPYRKRMNFDKAVSIIREVSGTQLTSDVVDAFLRLVDKGEFRAPDDHGGGSTENIENIHKEAKAGEPSENQK